MPFIEIETGARLYYEHHNPNADHVIVVLHGLLGTGRKDLGHVIDWLAAEGYQVIAPTLRGYGQSTPKPRDFPYRFYDRDANDVLAFIKQLDIKSCHLLGYSDGGEVALICAGSDPERFITVATIGAVGYMGVETRAVIMNYRPGSQWITPEELALHQITDADQFASQWVRSMVMLVDSGGDVALHLAPRIQARTLMILGDQDRLNPRQNAQKFLSQVPDGKLAMVKKTGHAVHDEQAQRFREIYHEHLNQTIL